MENQKQYYYISYQWRRNFDDWKIEDDVINVHPLKWLTVMRDDYEKFVEGGKTIRYDYTMLWWQEVSEEIYITYAGEFS